MMGSKRKSGILMHISSLPSEYGIGRFSKEAYDFVDYLAGCEQKYWQILPLSPTSYGDSPYQSFSIHAGNPYFIDLETLVEEGLLNKSDFESIKWYDDERYVDYDKLYKENFKVLRKAYAKFKNNVPKKFDEYIKCNDYWLSDYALFMSLKDAHNGSAWNYWETPLVKREEKAIKQAREKYKDDIGFWKFTQYKFFEQWFKLKEYANKSGIEIIGDIPIYVAYDSADVWCSPELFELDEDLSPINVAGCPPDIFSPLGQLWGNPLYNWDLMKKDNYSWWINRIETAKNTYDIVRIDHFRGFDSYYSIPFGDKDATGGQWKDGPKIDLFKAVKESLGKVNIIAEDLGFITPSVKKLLRQSGYPGMKVLEFSFEPDADSMYLPQNFKTSNCFVYTGTHDNDTLKGWTYTENKNNVKYAMDYLGVKRKKDLPWAIIRLAWTSTAKTAIAQLQDFLELGSEARMNIPSTVGNNWRWRALKSDFTPELQKKIAKLTRLCGR